MKRIVTLILIIMLLLTGCSGRYTLDPTPYASHPFDTSYIAYLGQPTKKVAKLLEQSESEWSDIYNEYGAPKGTVQRKKPFIMNEGKYKLSLNMYNWTGNFVPSVYYSRTLRSFDMTELADEITAVCIMMTDALGTPYDVPDQIEVTEAFAEGKDLPESGTYHAWWILDDDVKTAANRTIPMTLICHMKIRYEKNNTLIEVWYQLEPTYVRYERDWEKE